MIVPIKVPLLAWIIHWWRFVMLRDAPSKCHVVIDMFLKHHQLTCNLYFLFYPKPRREERILQQVRIWSLLETFIVSFLVVFLHRSVHHSPLYSSGMGLCVLLAILRYDRWRWMDLPRVFYRVVFHWVQHLFSMFSVPIVFYFIPGLQWPNKVRMSLCLHLVFLGKEFLIPCLHCSLQ